LGKVFQKLKLRNKIEFSSGKLIPHKETLVEQKLERKKRALDFIQVNLRPEHGSR
jgi:hypothetical protein